MKGNIKTAVAARAFGSPNDPKNLELLLIPKKIVVTKSNNKEVIYTNLGILSSRRDESREKANR